MHPNTFPVFYCTCKIESALRLLHASEVAQTPEPIVGWVLCPGLWQSIAETQGKQTFSHQNGAGEKLHTVLQKWFKIANYHLWYVPVLAYLLCMYRDNDWKWIIWQGVIGSGKVGSVVSSRVRNAIHSKCNTTLVWMLTHSTVIFTSLLDKNSKEDFLPLSVWL